jgi:hypothetical protein
MLGMTCKGLAPMQDIRKYVTWVLTSRLGYSCHTCARLQLQCGSVLPAPARLRRHGVEHEHASAREAPPDKASPVRSARSDSPPGCRRLTSASAPLLGVTTVSHDSLRPDMDCGFKRGRRLQSPDSCLALPTLRCHVHQPPWSHTMQAPHWHVNVFPTKASRVHRAAWVLDIADAHIEACDEEAVGSAYNPRNQCVAWDGVPTTPIQAGAVALVASHRSTSCSTSSEHLKELRQLQLLSASLSWVVRAMLDMYCT